MSYKRASVQAQANAKRQIASAPHHFALLGVNRRSTEREIVEARNALLRVVHPDRLLDDKGEDCSRWAPIVTQAATVLTDKKKRSMYLAELAAGRCKCPTCQGEGVTRKQKSMTNIVYLTCPTCHGAGLA
jgi:DnaJ-class molecular chaperone